MAQRPPRDLDWVPDNSTGINVPSQTKQNAGWLVEKPARQFFNWMWNRLSRWVHYNSGQSQEWIVIDSANVNEKDYNSLAQYTDDSPSVGDKVLIKETQFLAVQLIIPSGITLRVLDGVAFARSTLEANSVIKFGSDIIIEGILDLVLSHTGTTAKAIEFDGDNIVGKINVENSSTGILTTAYHVNAAKSANNVNGVAQNSGGGTLTNVVVDDAAEDTNLLTIYDEPNDQIIRSLGSNTFSSGVKFKLGSDADGDIYYRDAGILKRLSKGLDDSILSLASGLPAWQKSGWTFAAQVGSDLNIAGAGLSALVALNGTDVAFVDGLNDDLRTYRFDGATWTQVGNDLNIAGVDQRPALTALNDTDIAFIDQGNDDLRTYRFDGTDWTQVGNDLNISGIAGGVALAALNGTDIAFIDVDNKDLRTYRFDGTDWAQVGNDLNISGVGLSLALAALNGTDVAFIDQSNKDLRTYRFDGTDWAQEGNDLNISGIITPALAGFNGTDVVFIDEINEDLRIYRFDGTDWMQEGSDLNISGIGGPALTAINGTDVAFIDLTNKDLRIYRWNFDMFRPHHP